MKPLKLWALAAVIGVAACSDSQDGPLAPADPELEASRSSGSRVTNSNDAGPGSFRAAVAAANASASIRAIEFGPGLRPISLQQPVVYTGAQALEIKGNGATLDGAGLAPSAAAAFLANGGGNLTLSGLTVRNAPQHGLTIEIPTGATGTKRLVLVNVRALGNRGHGILINDQVDPLDTTNPNGSDASLDVSVIGCRFADNGFSVLDRDGLRINEGGNGALVALVTLTHAQHNGADGIEFDERGLGDVRFKISASQFTENGSFDVTLADLDDGFDIDESNEGSLIGSVILSSANDNFEEGFDFNENHEGDFRVDMTLAEASRNVEEGIDFEEDDDVAGGGNLIATLVGIKANGNGPGGDAGLKIRERGDGDLEATVRGAETTGNAIGGINIREQQAGSLVTRIEKATATGNRLAGIAVREDDDGSLSANIDRSTADGNTSHGIDFDENSTGDLTATVRKSSSSNNSGAGSAGVRADQQLPGEGTLNLIATTLIGNTGGPIVSNAGVTVTQTP
jgi:hypothetical protein